MESEKIFFNLVQSFACVLGRPTQMGLPPLKWAWASPPWRVKGTFSFIIAKASRLHQWRVL